MMNDFFKRNLVWVTILLCIAGVVLSIIGIPIGNPIFFFIGIILAIPTIGYLIYQVFFDRDKVELNLAPTTTKISRSNITSIINEKSEILLADKITNEDDLESLYHGFANEQEISKKLHEVTTQEHERAFSELPEIVLPSADPNDFEDFVYEDQNNNTLAIETTTNQELMQQRETALTTPANFEPEIPDEIIEEEIENNIEKLNEEIVNEVLPTNEITKPNNNDEFFAMSTENTTISLDDPNFVPVERVMPETKPEQFKTKNMIIRINPQRAELRKRKAEEKKANFFKMCYTLLKEILNYYGQSVFFAVTAVIDILIMAFCYMFNDKGPFVWNWKLLTWSYLILFTVLIIRIPFRIYREYARISLVDKDKTE